MEASARWKLHEQNEALLRALSNQYPCPSCRLACEVSPEVVRGKDLVELMDLGLVLQKVLDESDTEGVKLLYFSETEVTNAMYAAYLEDTRQLRDDTALEAAAELETSSTIAPAIDIRNPLSLWRSGGPPKDRRDHPVSFVTTRQAMEFCAWLSERYDLDGSFRLPMEAEWLFAAYGHDRKFPWGNDERRWTGQDTEPVKQRPELRTPQGLYGMWGNVSELVLVPSYGYGSTEDEQPAITKWLGANYVDETVRGKPIQPRQDYWGYTHSEHSRRDVWGFRVVFVPDQ